MSRYSTLSHIKQNQRHQMDEEAIVGHTRSLQWPHSSYSITARTRSSASGHYIQNVRIGLLWWWRGPANLTFWFRNQCIYRWTTAGTVGVVKIVRSYPFGGGMHTCSLYWPFGSSSLWQPYLCSSSCPTSLVGFSAYASSPCYLQYFCTNA